MTDKKDGSSSSEKDNVEKCFVCGTPWLVRASSEKLECECGNCGLKLSGTVRSGDHD